MHKRVNPMCVDTPVFSILTQYVVMMFQQYFESTLYNRAYRRSWSLRLFTAKTSKMPNTRVKGTTKQK